MAFDPYSIEPEEQDRHRSAPPPRVNGRAGTREQQYAQTALSGECDDLRATPEGGRNARLNVAALKLGTYVALGWIARSEVEAALYEAATAAGLEHAEIVATTRSGLDAGIKTPRPVELADRGHQRIRHALVEAATVAVDSGMWEPPSTVGYALTDLGNAERLVTRHGADIRYCWPWGKWLAWDGRRRQRDDTGQMLRLAQATVRAIYTEAAEADTKDKAKVIADHARRCEATGRLQAMLTQAQALVPVLPEELDRDPWLYNTESGTTDLRTGRLSLHRREDNLTRLAAVTYDPDAACPRWEAFLEQVLPDPEVRAFVQRAIGYSLTGSVREQCLFFLYGTGANGKSTFLHTLLAVLGEYGKQVRPEIFMLSRNDQHPTEIADLAGMRFIVTTELEEGRRVAEMMVKQLTGGDRLTARRMREDFWEFEPTHKLWLAGNHKPVIRGTDNAIWRRIHLIPFTVTIPAQEQNKELPDLLRTELPGILQWAVNGCLAWQRDGLGIPKAVGDATAGYRAEMDIIGGFLTDRCVMEPDLSATAKDLYNAYTDWAKDNGETVMSNRLFAKCLAERGLIARRTNAARMWQGIGLMHGLGSSDAN